MKIIDLHLDIADIFKTFKYSIDDFYIEKSDATITLKKLQSADISIIGPTLYFDKGFVKTSFYDGAKEYLRFYNNLFSLSDLFYQIKSSSDFDNENKNNGRIGYLYTMGCAALVQLGITIIYTLQAAPVKMTPESPLWVRRS